MSAFIFILTFGAQMNSGRLVLFKRTLRVRSCQGCSVQRPSRFLLHTSRPLRTLRAILRRTLPTLDFEIPIARQPLLTLSDDIIAKLLKNLEHFPLRIFSPHELMSDSGAPFTEVFVVINGLVEVSATSSEAVHHVMFVMRGLDFINAFSALNGLPEAVMRTVALSHVTCRAVPVSDFLKLNPTVLATLRGYYEVAPHFVLHRARVGGDSINAADVAPIISAILQYDTNRRNALDLAQLSTLIEDLTQVTVSPAQLARQLRWPDGAAAPYRLATVTDILFWMHLNDCSTLDEWAEHVTTRASRIVGPSDPPSVIFHDTLREILHETGDQYVRFPPTIILVTGPPGSGKGTVAPYLSSYLGLNTPVLALQNALARHPAARTVMEEGVLITDRIVIGILLRELLSPAYAEGAIIIGFPRTSVQAEIVLCLHSYMNDNRDKCALTGTLRRPLIRVLHLHVSEDVSIQRQLARGEELREQNRRLVERGSDKQVPLRSTDFSPTLARLKYTKYMSATADALRVLATRLPFNIVDADRPETDVRDAVLSEMRYQSRLQLGPEAFAYVTRLPRASDVTANSQRSLVKRLKQFWRPETRVLFESVLAVLKLRFERILRDQAMSGAAVIRVRDDIFLDPRAMRIALDVLAERGYHATVDRLEHIGPFGERLSMTFQFTVRLCVGLSSFCSFCFSATASAYRKQRTHCTPFVTTLRSCTTPRTHFRSAFRFLDCRGFVGSPPTHCDSCLSRKLPVFYFRVTKCFYWRLCCCSVERQRVTTELCTSIMRLLARLRMAVGPF